MTGDHGSTSIFMTCHNWTGTVPVDVVHPRYSGMLLVLLTFVLGQSQTRHCHFRVLEAPPDKRVPLPNLVTPLIFVSVLFTMH